MRLIMLLGAAHGTVVECDHTPTQFRLAKKSQVNPVIIPDTFEGDLKAGLDNLYYEYVLIAHGPDEAYYAPRGFNNLQVIKGLLAAQ